MSIMHCSLLSLGCAFGFAAPTEHTQLTALRALKIAQRRLRPEVRSKLLSVSSARTNGNLTPGAWRFVFLDEATSGRCRIVTVAAKTSSEHPDTVEAFSSAKTEDVAALHAIPQTKLVFDSDQVLEQLQRGAKLKHIHGAEYRLVQPKGGKEPLWEVRFYGDGEEPVSGFHVGAKTGALEAVKELVTA